MDQGQRPKWHKPSLGVVLRRRPEESVMTNCKNFGLPAGPDSSNASCHYISGCSDCYSQFPS